MTLLFPSHPHLPPIYQFHLPLRTSTVRAEPTLDPPLWFLLLSPLCRQLHPTDCVIQDQCLWIAFRGWESSGAWAQSEQLLPPTSIHGPCFYNGGASGHLGLGSPRPSSSLWHEQRTEQLGKKKKPSWEEKEKQQFERPKAESLLSGHWLGFFIGPLNLML